MDSERTAPVCDFLHVHEDAVDEVLRLLPPEERLYDLAEVAKLVRFRREGKTVFYTLDDDHVRSVLELGMEHVLEK